MQHRRPARAEQGFSLVELLVVITIIGILATIVTVKVMDAVSQARLTKARTEISEIKKAIGMFYVQVGKMPESLEELRQPTKGNEEGFIDIGKDPWGNEYEFERLSGRKYIIRCFGADGSPGGEGQDADIDSDHLSDETTSGGGK